jgi:hypothetical protein
MRWKPKPPKPKPEIGAKRYKMVFAFVPHLVSAASGPHGWEGNWVWLEWVIREQICWGHWGTWDWLPLEAKSFVGL